MIVIFSESDDRSTTEVMKWLRIMGVTELIRINEDVLDFHFSMALTDSISVIELKINNKYIPLSKIKSVWFRRAHYNSISKECFTELNNFSTLKNNIHNFLIKENNVLTEVLWHFISKKNKIGNPFFQNLNKIVVLEKAKSLGIKIPKTYIKFEKENIGHQIITKALSEGPFWTVNNYELNYKTFILNDEKYNNQNIYFFPTLIQDEIDKQFEIRTFYIKGEFYSMAIFSQENEKTKVDFRNYDKVNPNRNIPFKLQKNEEKKIHKLMQKIGLNTGSIDIIFSKSNEYIFLEVNPVGQYDMVSAPCNYNLHKKIAVELTSSI